MASLIGKKGVYEGEKFTLTADVDFVIGREKEKCQLALEFDNVSRRHAVITCRSSQYYIEDEKSLNNTHVDGKPIRGEGLIPLHDGARIRFCDHVYEFRVGFIEEEKGSDSLHSSIDMSLSSSSVKYLESQSAKTLTWLLDLTAELTETLDENQILARVVDSLFQLFSKADRVFLFLVDDETNQLQPFIVRMRSDDRPESADYSKTGIERCFNDREAILGKNAQVEFGTDSVIRSEMYSVLYAPLQGRTDDVLGVIQLDTQTAAKKFDEEDVELLMAVARQTAIALEHVKAHRELLTFEKLKRDLELARQIQYGLLPQAYPQIPGYEFAAYYESAREVGGDYYDFIPLADGKMVVLLGDVSGKGMPAAMMMARIGSVARYAIQSEASLSTAMAKLNQLTYEINDLERFVTLSCACIDPDKHAVTLVNAGHMPPLFFSQATGEIRDALSSEQGGLPLGVKDDEAYLEWTISLSPGDALLLYSDGVTDGVSADQQSFGMEGIMKALANNRHNPAAMLDGLVDALESHTKGCAQFDDITVVCFGRTLLL